VLFCSNGDRCDHAPWGVKGGGPGSLSAFRILRDGETIELTSQNTFMTRKGDVVVVETCGGGGWGTPAG
jgi:N-methylhydantoinase B/oxoprolinase/acetone carboxylase alpha subunit